MPTCTQSVFRKATTVFFMIAALTLGACGGGGGGGGSSSGSSATPPGGSSATSNSSASSSSATSSSSSSSTSSLSLYVTDPNIAGCYAGELKNSERTTVLNAVNAIRARHGLLPLAYDATQDSAAAEAALYMLANLELTTTPVPGRRCYTTGAATLAAISSTYLGTTGAADSQNVPSTLPLTAYLINPGVNTLAARRRLLDPFLASTAFGRVDGQPVGSSSHYVSMALKTQGSYVSDISAMSNDFIAYPYGMYPASDFDASWYLSFSAIASKTNAAANGAGQVDYSGATISVMDGATPLSVTNVAADYTGYGLPNSLQWRVTGLQNNVTYAVRIDNVSVNGVARQYNYTFRLQ